MSIFDKNNVIAQDDDEDYSQSGYIVCVSGNDAGIGNYSHCSCYGTWDGDSFDGREVWIGTVAELIDLATRNADPAMPERTVSVEDSDGNHLLECYKEVRTWAENRK